MNLLQTYKYYVIYFLTLAIMLLIVSVIFIYPAFHKIISIKNEISQEKLELEAKLNLGLNAKKIKEELTEVENSFQNLDTIFIKQGDELKLLSDLEELATKNQVTLTIKPDFNGQNVSNNITKIPLELNVSGNFNKLMAFINGLDSINFYFVTDTFDLKKSDTTLNLTLIGQAYIKK